MRYLAVLLAFGLCACSDKTSPADPPDAATDGGADTGTDAGPKPIVEAHEPTPVATDRWLVARVPDSSADPLIASMFDGSFVMPVEGPAPPLTWRAVTPGKNGELGGATPTGLLYGAASVELAEGTYLFGKFDNAVGSFSRGAYMPGDVYASGAIRVPVETVPGPNVVVVRGWGARGGQVQAQLFSTPDEVVFNTADLTTPELVVGDKSEQWLGVPVLQLSPARADDVRVVVEDSAAFAATEVRLPALAPRSLTQVAFKLVPKAAWPTAGVKVPVTIRIDGSGLAASYRRTVQLDTVAATATYKRTFQSGIDGSAQYYGVVPPKDFDASKKYAFVLALHGASVQGIGHAKAYSAKDWAYIVAPTNRRPYGFDWEAYGRLDALEILDLASATFGTADDRVYLTGHSMGGHGTWQLGVLFPGRFAVLGPSAGWISFETYSGTPRATGAIGRAQASSNTLDYKGNLARRGAYAIHGDADDNVPVSEERNMVAALKGVTDDVVVWEQPGAGHWWDGDKAAGADCVDWPDLFTFMDKRRLDPTELVFSFRTPSPSVSPRHSFVSIRSAKTSWADVEIVATNAGDTETLVTKNVRTMLLDGKALRGKGVTKIVIDGAAPSAVPDGPLVVGPETGKKPGVYGPLMEAFARPFCVVHEDGAEASRRYSNWLVAQWAIIGNGAACIVPLSRVDAELRKSKNLIYVGVSATKVPGVPSYLAWDETGSSVHGVRKDGAALVAIFPDGDRLDVILVAPAGLETLLYRYQPFSSRAGMPDWFRVGKTGLVDSGFFSADWAGADAPP